MLCSVAISSNLKYMLIGTDNNSGICKKKKKNAHY